ncbi:hypothetical protein ACVWXP_007424 [Bradyrhizobium sp. USDA 4463]
MKILFSATDNPTDVRVLLGADEVLGEQANCRVFSCNDCALVASETIMPAAPFQALSLKKPSLWR